MTGQYVYIVAPNKEGPVKFGYSSNPEERLRQLQTGSPERLVLLNVRDFKEERFARFAEERIHHELRQFSTHGGYYEWFNISTIEAEMVLSDFPFYGALSVYEKYERPYEYGISNHISDLIDDEELGGICDDMVALFDETFPSNVKEYENMNPLSDVQDLDDGWNEIFPMEKLAYFE
tara:strand:+ start:372 stop:902 length:531 start_codon:yes stop_codon:yes gene_type:complete